MISAGQALFSLGFTKTAWLDVTQGHPGTRREGKFRPEVPTTNPLGRWGTDLRTIEFLPENYASGHASGANNLAPALLPAVLSRLGFAVEANTNDDTSDLDLVAGATQFVLSEAAKMGLLPQQPPAPPPPPVQPSPPPVAPPPAGSGLSAPEQRVDELWAWIGQQWPTVRPVAVAALKMFRKAVGR